MAPIDNQPKAQKPAAKTKKRAAAQIVTVGIHTLLGLLLGLSIFSYYSLDYSLSNINSMQAQVLTLSEEMSEFSSKLSQLDSQIEGLDKVSEKIEKLVNLKDTLSKNKDTISSLKTNLDRNNRSLDKLSLGLTTVFNSYEQILNVFENTKQINFGLLQITKAELGYFYYAARIPRSSLRG